jgi:uroporphyrinogen III methyltransferase/synthase
MTDQPLDGRSVVVTRSRAQSSRLVYGLTDLGALVVELPVIEIEDPPDGGEALAGAADRLVDGGYEWVVLTSSNAVDRLLRALGGRPVPERVRWAAVGTGTARTLAIADIDVDLVPTSSISDALGLEFPANSGGAGPTTAADGHPRVLFPRAERVQGSVARSLSDKGWTVDDVIAYRTGTGRPDASAVADARRADAIAFTSSSTVERTVALLGTADIPPVVVSIGPVTSATARQAGLHVTAEASPHSIEGVIDALVRAVSEGRDHDRRP